MNRGLFEQLVRDFCRLCGMDEPERILQGGPIAVDDVVFSLVYSDAVNPDLCFIYCDFGELPAGKEAPAMKALLEANLYLHTGSGPVFAISADSGRVVAADHRRVADVKAADLRGTLVQLSEQARLWRTHHFLKDDAAQKRAPAAAANAAQAAARPAAVPARSPFAR